MTRTDSFNSFIKNYNQCDTLNIFGQNFGVTSNNGSLVDNPQPTSASLPNLSHEFTIPVGLPNCGCIGENNNVGEGIIDVDQKCDDVKLYNHSCPPTDASNVYDYVLNLEQYFSSQKTLIKCCETMGWAYSFYTKCSTVSAELKTFICAFYNYWLTYNILMASTSNTIICNLSKYNAAKSVLFTLLCKYIRLAKQDFSLVFGQGNIFSDICELTNQKAYINLLEKIKEVLVNKKCGEEKQTDCCEKENCESELDCCKTTCENQILNSLQQISTFFNLATVTQAYTIGGVQYFFTYSYDMAATYTSPQMWYYQNTSPVYPLTSVSVTPPVSPTAPQLTIGSNLPVSMNPVTGTLVSTAGYLLYFSIITGPSLTGFTLGITTNNVIILTNGAVQISPPDYAIITTEMLHTPGVSSISAVETLYTTEYNQFCKSGVTVESTYLLPNIVVPNTPMNVTFNLGELSLNFYNTYLYYLENPCSSNALQDLMTAEQNLNVMIQTYLSTGANYSVFQSFMTDGLPNIQGTNFGVFDNDTIDVNNFNTLEQYLTTLYVIISNCISCQSQPCAKKCCKPSCEIELLKEFCVLSRQIDSMVGDFDDNANPGDEDDWNMEVLMNYHPYSGTPGKGTEVIGNGWSLPSYFDNTGTPQVNPDGTFSTFPTLNPNANVSVSDPTDMLPPFQVKLQKLNQTLSCSKTKASVILNYVPIGQCWPQIANPPTKLETDIGYDITPFDSTGQTSPINAVYNAPVFGYVPDISVSIGSGGCDTTVSFCLGTLMQTYYNAFIILKTSLCGPQDNYTQKLQNFQDALAALSTGVCNILNSTCFGINNPLFDPVFFGYTPPTVTVDDTTVNGNDGVKGGIKAALQCICNTATKCNNKISCCGTVSCISQFILELLNFIDSQPNADCGWDKMCQKFSSSCEHQDVQNDNKSCSTGCNPCAPTNQCNDGGDCDNSVCTEFMLNKQIDLINFFNCNQQLNKCSDPRMLAVYMYRWFLQELQGTNCCLSGNLCKLHHSVENDKYEICNLKGDFCELRCSVCNLSKDVEILKVCCSNVVSECRNKCDKCDHKCNNKCNNKCDHKCDNNCMGGCEHKCENKCDHKCNNKNDNKPCNNKPTNKCQSSPPPPPPQHSQHSPHSQNSFDSESIQYKPKHREHKEYRCSQEKPCGQCNLCVEDEDNISRPQNQRNTLYRKPRTQQEVLKYKEKSKIVCDTQSDQGCVDKCTDTGEVKDLKRRVEYLELQIYRLLRREK